MEVRTQIMDVDRENFEEVVLQGSRERVIVVDFWAPWCAPCRTLGPLLEDVVRSLGPGVALARVNVDENQELAMAFRVQGIPAVKIIRDGQLVQEFTGALPRQQIEAILKPLVPSQVTEEEELQDEAQQRLARGDLKGAARVYEQVLKKRPDDAAALLGLARVRLQQGDTKAVQELVGRVDEAAPERAQAQALLAQIQFAEVCRQAGGRGACSQRALSAPQDLEARYALGCCAAAAGDFEAALKEWLGIVERDRAFRNGAAREAMVAVFHLLGRENELVAQYQRRLYQTLY
ncbi:MAG: tetratricopeptide repeat protein [Candidatus Latescibacterota bacterium]